jgi:hypothetical protein
VIGSEAIFKAIHEEMLSQAPTRAHSTATHLSVCAGVRKSRRAHARLWVCVARVAGGGAGCFVSAHTLPVACAMPTVALYAQSQIAVVRVSLRSNSSPRLAALVAQVTASPP